MRQVFEVDEYGRPLYPSPQYANEVHGAREVPQYAPAPQQYGPPRPSAPERPRELEEMIHEAAGVEAEPDEPRERGRVVAHWVGIVLGCAVIGVLVGGAIVLFLKFVNGPVSAKATADPLEAARQAAAPTPSTNVFQGKQIYLKYPSTFNSMGEAAQQGGGLDAYNISAKNNSQTVMALAVVYLKSMLIDDDSGYKYRSMHPELYTSKQLSLGGEKAYLMTKTDKTEATLFWPHNGTDLNLAITSSDPHVSPSEVMQTIMPTIRWVK